MRQTDTDPLLLPWMDDPPNPTHNPPNAYLVVDKGHVHCHVLDPREPPSAAGHACCCPWGLHAEGLAKGRLGQERRGHSPCCLFCFVGGRGGRVRKEGGRAQCGVCRAWVQSAWVGWSGCMKTHIRLALFDRHHNAASPPHPLTKRIKGRRHPPILAHHHRERGTQVEEGGQEGCVGNG